jgi:glycyl-tRNA synthetase beta chain
MPDAPSRGATFLLEVGCEEIPAPMIPKALDDLASGIVQALGPLAAGADVSKEFGGPRRLVALVRGIREREEDREETVFGPARAVAFDPQGLPTRAALGFAKGQGVDVTDLRVVASPKGDVVAATRMVRGRTAADLLASSCPRVLESMRFGKMMKWGDRGFVFVRPLHWIVALLGEAIVPFEFMGVTSGRRTSGHRFLGPGPHVIASPAEYETVLRERGGIVARIEERRGRLLDLAAKEAAAAGGRLRPDPGLVEELTFLTEHPAVVRGSFPEEYLALPEPVLVTTMRHHQKYLTVEDSSGRLRNAFVAVLTTDPDGDGLIRTGNEWVLKARLADAKFFYEEDRKRPLTARAKDLERVTFHAKLGSYAAKVERMERLLAGLQRAAGVRDEAASDAALAVRLCKSDLTTGMVGEFPELQGIIGGIYARREGIPEGAARAIEEHYRPAGAHDPVPSMGAPALVALSDKLDTLAVCFAAGFVPKGSADPYALRRAAMGLLRTLIENEIRLDLEPHLDAALSLAAGAGFGREGTAAGGRAGTRKGKPAVEADPRTALIEFLSQRLRFLMEESGVRFDAARAALAVGWSDPLLAWRRAKALNALRGQDDFLALAAAAKRVRNILGQAVDRGMSLEGRSLQKDRLAGGAESILFEAMRGARERAETLAMQDDHRGALVAIAALRPSVDRFFDDVLVMDPDEEVRLNRLTLLAELAALLKREADFAEIVVEGEPAAA